VVSSLDDAVPISPASPIESSPLSSPPDEPDIKAAEAHEDEAADGARKSVSAGATPVHEGLAKGDPTLPFECPDCEKTYSNEKSLKVGYNVDCIFASLLTMFAASHQRQELGLFQGARDGQ
jgi:hypothetical protein